MSSGRNIRVMERDRFFDDSFFKEAWDDFDKAMQSVLDRFDNTGLKVSSNSRGECRNVYSKIRKTNIDQDLYASQALQINEKDGKFQVVMDVKDFNPRELQVRAVDDRIVVEGSYEKTSDDGSSSSCKSFYKEFSLPSAADIDHVSTALSKDGVLTIKAPRKQTQDAILQNNNNSNLQQQQQQQRLHQNPCSNNNNNNTSTSSSTSSSTSKQQQIINDNNTTTSTSSYKTTASRRIIQSSSSFESSSDSFDALPSLPKDLREKLVMSDSGVGSSKTSTCSSPVSSESGTEYSGSRVASTMEFDLGKRNPVRTEVAFNVRANQGSNQAFPAPQANPQVPQHSQKQGTYPHPQQTPQTYPNSFPQHQNYPQSPPLSPSYPQSPPQHPQQTPVYPQSPPPQEMFQQIGPQMYNQFSEFPPQFQPQFQPPQPNVQSPPPPQPNVQSPPPPQSNVQSPTPPQYQYPQNPSYQPTSHPQMNPYEIPQPQFPQYQQGPVAPQGSPRVPQAAMGSGRQSSRTVTEENGRRVVTSQMSDMVQERDGFKERKETTAEIVDKDSQAARREAITKLSKVEEDPEGKFKRAESTDAEEVSETCIQTLPDGSVMSVKKNNTSSSLKQFSTFSMSDMGGMGMGGMGLSGMGGMGGMGGFFPQVNFPQGLDEFRGMMGRGHNLMSQRSSDSIASTMSGRSGFSDMSNFSHFTDASSPFSDISFGNMQQSGFPRSKQPQPQQQQQSQQSQQQQFQSPPPPPPPFTKSFTSSSSSSSSSFNQTFSNFGGDQSNF